MAAIGLVFDFNSGGHAGVGMAMFALAAFVLLECRSWLRRSGPIAQVAVAAGTVMVLLLLIASGNLAFGQPLPPGRAILWRAAATGAYTAAASLPMWMILDWWRDARSARFAPAVR